MKRWISSADAPSSTSCSKDRCAGVQIIDGREPDRSDNLKIFRHIEAWRARPHSSLESQPWHSRTKL
eukprot:274052-Pyramimonas_sp.AAC.1